MPEKLDYRIKIQKKDSDCAVWCAKRMATYGIVWGTCGTLAVRNEDGLLVEMTPNHLKSMVRRDYIESNGHHPGLSRIIDDIIVYARGYAALNPENAVYTQLHGRLPT